MTNPLKIFLVTLAILICVITISSLALYQNLRKQIQDKSFAYWSSGDQRRGGYVIQNSIKNKNKKAFVLQKIGFNNAVSQILVVTEENDNNPKIQVESFYFRRKDNLNFIIVDSQISTTTKYNFEKLYEIARKYDIYKENPDPTNIKNYPNLNIEQNLKAANVFQETDEQYVNRRIAELNDVERELLISNFPSINYENYTSVRKWMEQNYPEKKE